MSATLVDALTEAVLWLKNEPQDSRLTEVTFGQYTDGSGFWWSLEFSHRVHNSAVGENHQDDERRTGMVVRAWAEQHARFLHELEQK